MKNNLLRIVMVFSVLAVIIGYIAYVNFPTEYHTVYIEYKFKRDNNCYLVGTSTVGNKRKTELYKVDAQDYDNFLVNFDYSISTVRLNNWSSMNKTVHNFRSREYETND